MTDFKDQDEAVSGVIEFYREAGYSEALLTALTELLTKYIKGTINYDELALYFDVKLQAQSIYYDNAQVYLVMMNALLKLFEYNKHE